MANVAFSYAIILTDPVAVASLQAQYPQGIAIPPVQAAAAFGCQIDYLGPPLGGAFPAPVVVGGGTWYEVGINPADPLLTTASPVITYGSVEQFTVTWSSGGPQSTTTTTFYWVGYFFLSKPATAPTPPSSAPKIGHRVWVDGFEIPNQGQGGTGAATAGQIRDAARVDGRGYAYRNSGSLAILHTIPSGPDQANVHWERFYIRLRKLPVGGVDEIWANFGAGSGLSAAILAVNAAGQVQAYNLGSGVYPGSLMGSSSALTLGVWYRLELREQFATGAGGFGSSFSLYLNGVLQFRQNAIGGVGGLLNQGNHTSSQMGSEGAGQHGLECDMDDWICAAEPAPGVPGFDLTSGSHVRVFRIQGPNSPSWTGDWKTLTAIPNNNIPASCLLASTTPGANLSLSTDYQDADQQLGAVAYGVSVFIPTGPGFAFKGSLGVTAGDGSNVSTVIGMTASSTPVSLFTSPDNTTLPVPRRLSLTVNFTKDSSANNVQLQVMFAFAEFCGSFGLEDGGASAYPPPFNVHNWPYPNDNANTSQVPPLGMVVHMQGTYAGNGTAQDILLSAAAHWIFVRNITTPATQGCWWYTGMDAAHNTQGQGEAPQRMIHAYTDPVSHNSFFRVGGSGTEINAVGQNYQWVAVSDATMRYMLNGQFSKNNAAASPNSVATVDPAFTPDGGFLFLEVVAGSAADGHYFRGPGHTGNQASLVNGNVNNNVVSFGAGTIAPLTAIMNAPPDTAYSLWRKSDGTFAGGVDITSYVGDGTGAKNIALALGGNTPMWVLVIAHSATGGYYRDPSHAGTNAAPIGGGAVLTTAITAVANNQITVGLTLNALGVTHEVFALSGALFPVPFAPRTGGPYATPVPDPGPSSTACITLAQFIAELLQRLGDSGGVHWTSTECTRYALETLRVWNGLTMTARARGQFNTVNGTVFYDLPTQLPALRGYNLKDQDLITDLEYALMEPPTPTAWTGTPMFNLTVLTQVIQRRRDRLIRETGIVVSRETAAVAPDANGRVSLPNDTMIVRRAAWLSANGYAPLLRDDEWALNAFKLTWPTPVPAQTYTPKAYSVGVEPPLTLQLAPPPTVAGTLETLSAPVGATLNPATGVLLGIPDDYAWVAKWGAIFDLLSAPGPANDPSRAEIARSMWELGVKAAAQSGVVLDAQVNGAIVRVTGLGDADRYQRNWQNVLGTPKAVLVANQNLIAFLNVPDNVYTITLDVVRNQPVPVLLTDCFIVGGVGITSTLLDYAEFLCRFREGPEQAQEATALLESFLKATGLEQAIDQAKVFNRAALLRESKRDDATVPYTKSPPEPLK